MASFVPSFVKGEKNIQRNSFSQLRFKMQTLQSAGTSTNSARKITLYSMPASNYSARCRFLIKRKNLPKDAVSIRPPSDLRGMKTEEYRRLNPLGKTPTIVVEDENREECIFESSVICEYLADVFSDSEPSFIPNAPEARARSRLIANILDVYVGPHHPYMYKKVEGDRESGVKNMLPGFDALEHTIDSQGPYVTGEELSIGDCCLWGNLPFYDFMLPTFFGWHPTDGRPKFAAWREHMFRESQAARDVYAEVFRSLQAWWDKGRWENLSMNAIMPRPELPF